MCFIGVAGYYYQQLTADSGQLAILGPNESRTRGVGPQIGYNFNLGGVSFTPTCAATPSSMPIAEFEVTRFSSQ
jgi:hypothetical protein